MHNCCVKNHFADPKLACFDFSSSNVNLQGHILNTTGVTLIKLLWDKSIKLGHLEILTAHFSEERERKKDVKELQGIGILPWLSAPHPTPKSSDIVVFSPLFLTLFTASHKVLVSNTEVQQGSQLERFLTPKQQL